jgi:hypothetical protein
MPNTDGQIAASYPGSIWRGIGIGAAINICALIGSIFAILIIVGSIVLIAFGLVQFAWILPICRHYRAKGETETAKGILIAAGISALLNASCWGVLVYPRH